MPFANSQLLDEIRDLLVTLDRRMHGEKVLKRLDAALGSENFVRDLLNLVEGWMLENANFSKPNQDSYDLTDSGSRIAVQVTVTTGAAKVRKTLTSFVPEHRGDFDRLLFFYPRLDVSPSGADFAAVLDGFDFSAKRDCWCLDHILEKANDLDTPELRSLRDFLSTRLTPLVSSLSRGLDPTMDAMIAVIEYMSENVPADEVEFLELSPDQEAKLARLRCDAERVLGEYRLHQELHVPLAVAREAVGCDTVRVAKIQKWLKIHSLRALDRCDGDAPRALDALAADLLERAHAGGTPAEEDAVRFLLADELINCNVFPNPAPDSE